MIPQKAGTDSDLNAQIDKDIAKAEEKSKEDIKKNKPKMAQAIVAKYIKYIVIAMTAIGIGYKMFFAQEKEIPKNKKTKKTAKLTTKEIEQQKLATNSIGKITNGEISKERVDAKKILSLEEQTMSNAEILNDIQVPQLKIPTVPNVPTIDRITIQDNDNNISNNDFNKANIDIEKKEANNNEKTKSKDDNAKKEKNAKKDNLKDEDSDTQQESNDKKSTRFTFRSKDNKGIKSGNLPDSPLSSRISKETNKKNSNNKKNNKNLAEDDADDLNIKAIEEMFVLNGQGQTENDNDKKNSYDKKDSFIVFDGSNISVQEASIVLSDANVTKMSNLENTIATGKVMEAVLETAINSESAGIVRAVISKDVLGERGNKILIPRGSRVFGSYSKTTSAVQKRLLITWNKVIRPDGVVITMQSDTYDQGGKKGIEGNIDTRYGEMFKNSLLYSFVTLGTAVALEKIAGIKGTTQYLSNGTVATANVTPSNIAAKSVIETTQDITKKMTDGLLDDLDPVISIQQGILITMVSNTDIVVPIAYSRRTYDTTITSSN